MATHLPSSAPVLTHRALLALIIPSTLFTVLRHAYRTVDHYWIQDVSTEAQAAIGSATFVLILFAGFFEVLSAGAAPIIARHIGAEQPEGVRKTLGAALGGVVVTSGLLMVVGGFGAKWLTAALGLEGQTAVECERYIETLSWTGLPLVLMPLVDQAFIAMGSARIPFILNAIILGLNCILTPLLVHTADMGVTGAALASNGATAVGAIIGGWLLARKTQLKPKHLRLGRELRRVIRVGMPMGISVVSYALVYWAMLYTSISPLGPHINAALGIGFSVLEGFAWPCFHGVSLAVASFVGRSIGAGRPEEADRAIRLAFPLTTGLGLVATAFFFFGGDFITGLMTEDPKVHEAATAYALILAASQLFVAWETLAEGILAGAGDTRSVFWLSVPFNVVRIPLAWAMAMPLGWGAVGVWWAINITTYGKAWAKAWAVKRGHWKTLVI